MYKSDIISLHIAQVFLFHAPLLLCSLELFNLLNRHNSYKIINTQLAEYDEAVLIASNSVQ